MAIGYIPFEVSATSAEAAFLQQHLELDVLLFRPSWEAQWQQGTMLPPLAVLESSVECLLGCPWVVAEGPQGFLWASVLRSAGFSGGITLLPYINPTGWYDVACIAAYRRLSSAADRIFLGSTVSAALYRALGVRADVGEPYGIDCEMFQLRGDAPTVRHDLCIPPGRILLFAGRVEPDKHLYTFLRVAFKAHLLFPDLRIVIAAHVLDDAYAALLERYVHTNRYPIHLIVKPLREQLAALYNAADLFVTAATSIYETFGRAPVEALSCGTAAVAPRYDGFRETLNQPGGVLVDLRITDDDIAVDEDALLRAVYDYLSARQRLDPQEIAAAAQARFCRCRTIHVLDYLRGAPCITQPSCAGIPRTGLVLPPAWETALGEVARLDPRAALAWLWQSDQHKQFASYDNGFQRSVRRYLATGVADSPDALLS